MGWASAINRLNPQKLLKLIVLFEMLYWCLSATATLMIYHFKDKTNVDVLNDIKAEFGSSRRNAEAEAKYRALLREWGFYTNLVALTAGALFLTQLFLLMGVIQKNRCLIFCWIVLMLIFGITRFIIISISQTSPSHNYNKYTSALWLLRIYYMYLAAKYMLQLTNENIGAEEVPPPHFRPQTEDPREFREGLNYPTFPRALEFADRLAAVDKQEHAHPKRWVPTYDAFDSEGRMVVVVDDPFYEAL